MSPVFYYRLVTRNNLRRGLRQYVSCKPLLSAGILGRPPTDASIVASNKEYLGTLGCSEEQFEKLQTRGNVLTLESGVLRERVNWLKERLGLEQDGIGKITQKQPEIFAQKSGSGTTLARKLDYLQERLDLDNTALSKMIQSLPAILGSSVPHKLEPTMKWLQERLNLDDDELSRVIQRLPAIVGLSIPDKLEPHLDWLQKRLSLTDEQLSNLIQRLPSLLGYSIENNLEPTINFYIEALVFDERKALALLIDEPSLFGYSLEKRLKPRLKEARDAGLNIDENCLIRIGKYTDEKWRASIVEQVKQLMMASLKFAN